MMDTGDKETKARPPLLVGLQIGGGIMLAIFAAGIAVGVVSASLQDGHLGAPVIIGLSVALVLLAVSGWLIWSSKLNFTLPRSPRVRRSRITLLAAIGVAAALGVAAGIAGKSSGDAADATLLFSSGPIAMRLAVLALTGWIVTVVLSAYWHITLDEIERAEYEFGATVALYGYMILAPSWWLAWRGGMVAAPNQVAIFMSVCVVWCIGWGWRRFR